MVLIAVAFSKQGWSGNCFTFSMMVVIKILKSNKSEEIFK